MMDIVKKNMVSIISGVVALLAIGLLFWPVQGYFTGLKEKVDGRVQVYNALNTLSTKTRNWPNTSLKSDAPVKQLEMYPTQRIYERGKALVDQMKAESGLMYQTAWELNKHTELFPGALPGPGSVASTSRFIQLYKQHVDITNYKERMNSNLVKTMKAGFLPHPEIVRLEQQRVRQEVFARATPNPAGGYFNQAELDEEVKLAEARIPIMLRLKAAQESLVYLRELSLDPYNAILTPGQIELHHVWIAQVNYWIHEDIAKAIAAANEGATSVENSAVKILFDMSIPAAGAFRSLSPGQQAAPSDMPKPEVEPLKNYANTITGRYASPLYDVVPCTLQLVVDATQVQRVLQALSQNRFITVTTCNIDIKDVSDYEAAGFTLGTNPIVQLTLNCEVLLFREWTIPLMPASIRRGLGLPEAAATK